MFTGLVTDVGTVITVTAIDGGRDIAFASAYRDLDTGESVAVDGACLTVTATAADSFTVHVIATSLDRTAFGNYSAGRRVNLERALRVGDRLGGHMVQGHVDGVGFVVGVDTRDDARLLDIRVPRDVAEVTVPLGSIAVDGVSLTVNAMIAADVVQVSLIPFTLDHTALGDRRVGDRVHLEGDMVGKHVRQLTQAWRPGDRS
jgi:riboflavin synthase